MIVVERTTSTATDRLIGATHPPDAGARLDFPSRRQPGWNLRVEYRTDERSAFVKLPGGWLYVSTPVGLECFPTLTDVLANAARHGGLHAAVDALEQQRPMAFVAYFENGEELHFGRSLDGFASLYFGGELPALVIAEDSLRVARMHGPVRLNEDDEAAWCADLMPHPEGSFLDGVKRCFAGVRYRIDLSNGVLTRRMMAPQADLLDQDASVTFLCDELRKICATYGNKRIALRLSGGVDSRTLLVGLMDAVREGILRRDQILCTSVLFPGHDCDESTEIREIARLSGFEWVGIEGTRERVTAAQEECLDQNAPPFPTSFIGRLCMAEARRRDAEIMVTGHGGDELFDFDLADVVDRPLRQRLRHLDLIRELRDTQGVVEEAKALGVAWLGRRGMRQLQATLRSYGFSNACGRAHRLGRRLGVAPGCGYEATAVAAAECGLFTDVPLYRAPFLKRFDPVVCRHPSGRRYKALEHLYMEAIAPKVAAVRFRAVAFDAMTANYFPTKLGNCDLVDDTNCLTYDRAAAFHAWLIRFGARGYHENVAGGIHDGR